jgi:hypothetical protein
MQQRVETVEIMKFSCLALVLVVAACGGSKNTGAATTSCTQGQQLTCTCPGTLTQGVSICQANGQFGLCSPCNAGVGAAGFGAAGVGYNTAGTSGAAGYGAAGVGAAGVGAAGVGAAGVGAAGVGAAGVGAAGTGAAGTTAATGTACAAGEACQMFGQFKYCAPAGSTLPPMCTGANMPCGMNNEGMCFDAGAAIPQFAGTFFCLTPGCM